MNIEQQLMNAKTWEERYRLIIQAGKNPPKQNKNQPPHLHTFLGSQLLLCLKLPQNHDRTFHFQAYSEARIMNGLLWILLQHIENKSAEQLRHFDLTAYFTHLGIAQRLSTTRLNGLKHIEQMLHHL